MVRLSTTCPVVTPVMSVDVEDRSRSPGRDRGSRSRRGLRSPDQSKGQRTKKRLAILQHGEAASCVRASARATRTFTETPNSMITVSFLSYVAYLREFQRSTSTQANSVMLELSHEVQMSFNDVHRLRLAPVHLNVGI